MDQRQKSLILCASVATVCTASFAIYQLTRILFSVVRDSEFEATKLLASVTAQIQSDSPDADIPDELELEDDIEEIYSYGTLQELYYRRNVGGDTDWQWSFDKEEWYSTGELTPDHTLILDPPSLIFISRLHLMSIARRKALAADTAATSSSRAAPRIPPPVELPEWAKQQQQQQQQQQQHQLHPAPASGYQQHMHNVTDHCNSSSSSSKCTQSSSSVSADHSRQEVSSSWPGSDGGSSSSSSSAGSTACRRQRVRRLEDAPELLCCPITGQVMLQPVSLPSGKTFEYEAIRRWITQHGTDPTTGLTPVSLHEVHPNLIVREMVEKWLTGLDPLVDHADMPTSTEQGPTVQEN